MPKGPKDTGKLSINTNYFGGGVSVDPKLAVANSYYYSQGLDFRSLPSQTSVLPAPSALSTNLSDNILAMAQDVNGVRWGVGSLGNVYKINTSNVISVEAKMTQNGSAGLLYNAVTDQLYIPGQTTVSLYGQVTSGIAGNPQFLNNHFSHSASTAPGCNQLYSTLTVGGYDQNGQPVYQATNGGGGANLFNGSFRNNTQEIATGITESNLSQVQTYATQTYSVPLTLTETTGNFCFFAPDIEPFHSIWVYITAKGTGNWTLTLHDSSNNALASVTVANANLKNKAYNEFKFSGPINATVSASQTGTSATYHWHVTSTVNDGTVGTINASDLSSADFLLFAYRLIQTNNGWHPTALFTGSGVPLLCIGNGRYLSTYNFSNDSNPTNNQWQRHELQFPPGYEVCGLSTNNQYLVIAVEKRSANSNRNFQDGALYFWDGSTNAPAFVIDIPMGAPYGLYTFNNVTYFACAGSLFAWSQGQTVLKVRKLAYQNTDYLGMVDHTVVNPNAFTSRYNLMMMGYPSSTTNPNLNYGIWSWGAVELTFTNSYGLSYTLSNGYLNNTSPISNLQIGCVYNFVDQMYISWSYTDASSVTHYGLDYLDNTSSAATSGKWMSLIYDGGSRFKQKYAHRMKVSGTNWSGITVTPFYILDRGTTVYSTQTTTGTSALLEINQRFHEIQYGFTFTCPTGLTTPPIFTGVTMEVSPLEEELDLIKEG